MRGTEPTSRVFSFNEAVLQIVTSAGVGSASALILEQIYVKNGFGSGSTTS